MRLGIYNEELDLWIDESLERACHGGVDQDELIATLEKWISLIRAGFFNFESKMVCMPDGEYGSIEAEDLRRVPLTEDGKCFLEKLDLLRRNTANGKDIHEGRQ